MFEIIKNAELPKRKKGGGRKAIYPFSVMEVGDGFDVPGDMGTAGGTVKRMKSVSSAARYYVKRHNPTAKFAVRALVMTDIVRCVRVA